MSMKKLPLDFILTGITSDNVHAVYRALLEIDPKSEELRSFVGRDADHYVHNDSDYTSWKFKNGEWSEWCYSEYYDREAPSEYENYVRISVNDLFKGKLPEPPKQPLLSDIFPI